LRLVIRESPGAVGCCLGFASIVADRIGAMELDRDSRPSYWHTRFRQRTLHPRPMLIPMWIGGASTGDRETACGDQEGNRAIHLYQPIRYSTTTTATIKAEMAAAVMRRASRGPRFGEVTPRSLEPSFVDLQAEPV